MAILKIVIENFDGLSLREPETAEAGADGRAETETEAEGEA